MNKKNIELENLITKFAQKSASNKMDIDVIYLFPSGRGIAKIDDIYYGIDKNQTKIWLNKKIVAGVGSVGKIVNVQDASELPTDF
jgi:hypothetical protein